MTRAKDSPVVLGGTPIRHAEYPTWPRIMAPESVWR